MFENMQHYVILSCPIREVKHTFMRTHNRKMIRREILRHTTNQPGSQSDSIISE